MPKPCRQRIHLVVQKCIAELVQTIFRVIGGNGYHTYFCATIIKYDWVVQYNTRYIVISPRGPWARYGAVPTRRNNKLGFININYTLCSRRAHGGARSRAWVFFFFFLRINFFFFLFHHHLLIGAAAAAAVHNRWRRSVNAAEQCLARRLSECELLIIV